MRRSMRRRLGTGRRPPLAGHLHEQWTGVAYHPIGDNLVGGLVDMIGVDEVELAAAVEDLTDIL